MDIGLQRDPHVAVAQHLADAFDIHILLDAACGVGVPQGMEISIRDARSFQQRPISVLHSTRFQRIAGACQQAETARVLGSVRCQQGQDISWQRYSPQRRFALGRLHNESCAAFLIDPLYLPFHPQKARMEVDVRPTQRTQLSQTKAAVQCQKDTKAGQVRRVHDMMCQLHDLRLGEYLHLSLFAYRKLGVYARAEAPPLGRHPQNGSQ